jgi:ABC-type glycerol-3-phosphate transport system substrate-binding protein
MNMPRLSWTWENVLDYSVQLKRQAAENDFKWGFALMGYMNYFFHSGVSFVDENGQCELDTPAMKRAVDFLKKMIVEEKIAPFWSDIRANNPMDMSMNGSSAIFEGYSFIKGKDDKGFEIEAMPFPFMPDSVDTLSSSPISISNKSSDIEGCLEFLKFIFSEEGQKIIASHVNSLPAMKSIVPPDISSERLKIQQKSAAEGELLYCRCLDIFSVRSIIESSVEQWLRFGGDLDKILKEAETICRWRIERKQQSKDTAFINI